MLSCVNANVMHILPLVAALIIASPLPALAADTPWQEIAPGVSVRLVSSGQVSSSGVTTIGLEIDMPSDTKTYWRVPGDTGLPLNLDFAGSKGIASYQVVWPYPTREKKGAYLDYVYYGPTVLPIELTLDGADTHAVVSATLGICSDICIPAQASFDLALSGASVDKVNSLRLRQALAQAPILWEESDEPLGEVDFLPDERAIAIEIADPNLDISSLIATTETGTPLFGMPQKSPQQDLVLLPILEKTENSGLEGRDVQLTFMTGMGAFELSRTIGADDE
ncbi:protein-disulfide reductase DsbD domain-containing protein [Devosia sp. SD17-2]|uniref:protein-disulfide reductase DsbD domain-containing protein n=1 Tax=Devosia sp. SD17-2 TaxID=2976459 RepID=UPI0023D8C30F|nr:protein-disulfide reductase DsbD domain-containing protein [Devosia sp. SD17-2]WEJ32519.1 protein-disulfide reductase DsbD family protein [Devosia sp. SD17-2]